MPQLHLGDCLDVLRTMHDSSVDAVVTDPPYGISYQSQRRVDKSKRRDVIAGDDAPFIWFLYDASRVLKQGGSVACFCEWRHAEAFRLAMQIAGLTIKSQVVWDRGWHGMGDLKGSFAPMHDIIWFAVKGKGFAFSGPRPKSVLRHQRIAGADLVHPTEKPVSLMREVVASITPPGGVVLDPFMGSGSTGKAAILEGFRFIGIERDPDYFAIAEARIRLAEKNKQNLKQLELPNGL